MRYIKPISILAIVLIPVLLVGYINLFLLNNTEKNQKSIDSGAPKELAGKLGRIYSTVLEKNPEIKFNVNVELEGKNPAFTQVLDRENKISTTFISSFFWESGEKQEIQKINKEFTKKVIIHELAHVLSLNNIQIGTKSTVNKENVNKDLFDKEEKNCLPNYYNLEGCFSENSYLSSFYKTFWNGESLSKSSDGFVSDVAKINVEEDLAESFSLWILGYGDYKPGKIQLEKINFFEKFSELKEIKSTIKKTFITEDL